MKKRTRSAVLIPYKIKDNEVFVFLQKRSEKAKVLAGLFSFFGGKMNEGEASEQALEREIREELNINLKSYQLLGEYPSRINPNVMLHVYVTLVDEAFEKDITVNEGEYGQFFSEKEVIHESRLIPGDKLILRDLFNRLKKNE